MRILSLWICWKPHGSRVASRTSRWRFSFRFLGAVLALVVVGRPSPIGDQYTLWRGGKRDKREGRKEKAGGRWGGRGGGKRGNEKGSERR